MKIALDTNVLAYAEGANGEAMQGRALELIQRLPASAIVLPVQILGELFNVLVRKVKRQPARARTALLSWRDAYPVVETSAAVMLNATDLASDHGLTIWDSVVLAASAEAGCRLLLSEDLQEGFTWQRVTVVNPFAPNFIRCWLLCSQREWSERSKREVLSPDSRNSSLIPCAILQVANTRKHFPRLRLLPAALQRSR